MNFIWFTGFLLRKLKALTLELIGKFKFTQRSQNMKKKENLRRIIRRNLCWDNQFFSTKGQGCHVSFNFLSFGSKKNWASKWTPEGITHYPPVKHSRNVSNFCPRNLKGKKIRQAALAAKQRKLSLLRTVLPWWWSKVCETQDQSVEPIKGMVNWT